MPHENSLLYNAIPVWWPMKAYWFTRKTVQLIFLRDFPTPPENHPDHAIDRSYFKVPGFMKH